MLKAPIFIGLLLCFASPAAAQLDKQIADLNRQALDAYQSLDIDAARAKLERAIKLAQRSDHASPTVAQTFLALGLVYVAGMNDQEQGLAAFVNAICMQRDVQLDPLLSTPAVKQVFAQAQNDARAGACGPDAAAPPPPPPPPEHKEPEVDLTVPNTGAVAATDSSLELDTEPECPPGMRCGGRGDDEAEEERKRGGFARFFLSVQVAGGFSLLRSGMEADSKPPALYSDTFVKSHVFRVTQELNPVTMQQENRFLFNTESPWVPDADSFDDLEQPGIMRGRQPLSDNCSADGQLSGPMAPGVTDRFGNPYSTMEPSKYCVRVAKPGFVPGLALRGNFGYWLSDVFALSLPLRFQFDAGQGSLAHMLVGLRGELLFSRPTSATGTFVSWFFGATYGQIQARPAAPSDSTVVGPYAKSGPFGVHTGMNIRFRLHRNFGFILAPEVDLQFPAVMPHGDISGGVETAF